MAASTRVRPAGVIPTRMPRPSFGAERRFTSPRSTRPSMRFVMVPLETRVCCSRAFGLSSYGVPARRRAESTSNSHDASSEREKAVRLARSRCFESRATRLSTCRGAKSRSGRSRSHESTIRSTSSWPGIALLSRLPGGFFAERPSRHAGGSAGRRNLADLTGCWPRPERSAIV